LQHVVDKRDVRPCNLIELAAALTVEWNNIMVETLNNLVDSMPRHLQAFLDARGGRTRY